MTASFCIRLIGDSEREHAVELNPERQSFTIGRDDDADIVIADRTVSRQHCRLTRTAGGFLIEDLGSRQGTQCNGVAITASMLVRPGDRIKVGRIMLLLESNSAPDDTLSAQALTEPPRTADEQDRPNVPPTYSTNDVTQRVAFGAVESHRDFGTSIRLKSGQTTIGRDAACDLALASPTISRRHAVIARVADGYQVLDVGSANGTFLNGARISAPMPLRPGDVLRIGPYELERNGDELQTRSAESGARIDVSGLCQQVADSHGRVTQLLRNVSFGVRPREFVGVLGLSGCGKSTLIDALNGRRPASSGGVYYDGHDLYAHFDAFKQGIGYVPQRLILHEQLQVEDVLRYACRLRLPPDTQEFEIEANIERVLKLVDLTHRRTTPVSNLSGGQQKRVAIAMEMLSRPSVLFLDEATSGLDQATETQMMSLFRSLADGGVTTICITHYADSLEQCDKIVYLIEGRLAFFGPPRAMKKHFGASSIRDILLREKELSPDEWQKRFHDSPYFERYVKSNDRPSVDDNAARAPRLTHFRPQVNALSQFLVLAERYSHTILRDRRSLAVSLLLAPLIGVLVGAALSAPDNINDLVKAVRSVVVDSPDAVQRTIEQLRIETQRQLNLGFIAMTSAFFLGLFAAIREVVKELPIYRHERFINLRIAPYLASKIVPLAVIAAVQVIELQFTINWFGHTISVENGWPVFGQFVTLWFTALAAITLGLAVSAAVKAEETAVALMVVLIVPQILFSNALRPLSGFTGFLGEWFIVGYSSLAALQSVTDRQFRGLTQVTYWPNVIRLLILAGFYALLAGWFLWRKDGKTPGVFTLAQEGMRNLPRFTQFLVNLMHRFRNQLDHWMKSPRRP